MMNISKWSPTIPKNIFPNLIGRIKWSSLATLSTPLFDHNGPNASPFCKSTSWNYVMAVLMVSYSVTGQAIIGVNATLVIDAWLVSSKLFDAMNDGTPDDTLFIIQAPFNLLDDVQEAMFYTFLKLQFYLILHRVVFDLNIMRKLIPSWKSSISN